MKVLIGVVLVLSCIIVLTCNTYCSITPSSPSAARGGCEFLTDPDRRAQG